MQRCHRKAEPKAALLDMDGTLYDSMPHHVEAWLTMLSEQGIIASETEILLAEGRTGVDTIRNIFAKYRGINMTEQDCRRLYARKSQLFAQMPEVSIMPGAQDLVEALQQAGLTTVLVTGSGQNTLLARLEKDFPGAFPENRRITAHNVTHGKPHPEPFLRGMELANSAPWQTLAFDNAPLGVQSAAAANAITIGVVTGRIPIESLQHAGADLVFSDMPSCASSFACLN